MSTLPITRTRKYSPPGRMLKNYLRCNCCLANVFQQPANPAQKAAMSLLPSLALFLAFTPGMASELPIADVHVHYSHDSVELTPPSRVIELMQKAGLKFALVSSSDDKGTRLLREAAPDLIIPGLRPYRKRGELRTWYTDPVALEYVEKLLASQSYATIGEFHLYGDTVDLPIPQKMVKLAEQHNLCLLYTSPSPRDATLSRMPSSA